MSEIIEIETNALNSDKNSASEELKQIQNELQELQSATESLNSSWDGPAATTYKNTMTENIENAMSVCEYLTKYISCIEEAIKNYNECEQNVGNIINSIRI